MEKILKERLIGAAVLVMLAVIFIPMILDDSSGPDIEIKETNIPDRPADNFSSRIVPLQESDLTPLVEETFPQQELVPVATNPEDPRTDPVEEEELTVDLTSTSVPEPQATQQKPALNKQVGATAWVVQLGSFSSETNANNLNEKLRKAGYPAFVEPLKKESGMAYRVRVGPELLRSDAQALLDKLNKNMQIDGIVIRYP